MSANPYAPVTVEVRRTAYGSFAVDFTVGSIRYGTRLHATRRTAERHAQLLREALGLS